MLIVESDRAAAEALQLLLEHWGYVVDVAQDAPQGFALATGQRPDAVVLELALPTVADGCVLVRQLRCTLGGDAMLILALTAHTRDVDRRRAMAAGCDFFFLKPADIDRLREALSTVAEHRERAIRARPR